MPLTFQWELRGVGVNSPLFGGLSGLRERSWISPILVYTWGVLGAQVPLSSGHHVLNASCSDSKDAPQGKPPGGLRWSAACSDASCGTARRFRGSLGAMWRCVREWQRGRLPPGFGSWAAPVRRPTKFRRVQASSQRGAMESIAESTRRISREIRAHQLSRIAGGAIKRLLDFVGRVAGRCELCQAFDKLLTCLLLGRPRRPRPMREFRLTLSFG